MMNNYTKVKHELMHKGNIVDFYQDSIELPNDKTVNWDYIQHKGASAIVPITSDGKIIMVRQYRIGSDSELLEIPAGGINSGEDPYETAVRELEEETGYTSNSVKHLIDVHSAPAYTSECVYIYYADNLIKSHQKFDEDEFIELESYELDELISMIMDGKITDGKTIAGLFAIKQVLLMN